jgi:hypothetical protein
MNKVVTMNAEPSNLVSMKGASSNSPLVNYALAGLRRCWLPELRRWSHIYHLDGRDRPNESRPPSDVFYTLNVLLGMSRLRESPADVNIRETFERNVGKLSEMRVAKYAFGMALWSGAELDLELPEDVTKATYELLANENEWWNFRAQDIGMLLMGVVAQARTGRTEFRRFAEPLFSFIAGRYRSESGLFFDAPSGYRRRFGSFASQTYLAMACYHYGEFIGNPTAIRIANACTRVLIGLQGPMGEWPWFFDARSGRVVDFYEVYSVHQYGMAPALLECAERHDVENARNALVKGFHWILGENQLNRTMLVPELQLSFRSQVRKNELQTKNRRILRSLGNAFAGRSSGLIDPKGVGLRLECRSYELGWIVWSFGRRADLNQLTHNPAFSRAFSNPRQSSYSN